MREIVRALIGRTEDISVVVPDQYQDGIDGVVLPLSKDRSWMFYKSHSARELLNFDGRRVKNDLIIYVLRNPLDVFCSQLNYLARGFDGANGGVEIEFTGAIDDLKGTPLLDDFFSAFMVYGTLMPFFRDARSWMQNASYWLDMAESDDRVMVVRYEDLIEDFESSLQDLTSRLGLIDSNYSAVRDMADGRTNDGGQFYWKKKSGTYKEYLSNKHINRFRILHHNILVKTGYNF